MTIVPAKYGWFILGAYCMMGLLLGFLDPWLGQAAQWLGTKPGAATAVSVNIVLPGVALLLGFIYGRMASVWLGALCLTAGFLIGLAWNYATGIRDWSPSAVFQAIPPVLVAATLGYAVLGMLSALAARVWLAQHPCEPT